ncbi:MAG: EAL domain-containing protein [Candidatus Dormibacteria bacterium]
MVDDESADTAPRGPAASAPGDAMLLSLLTLLNTAGDVDGVLEASLDVVSAAVGCLASELWLACDEPGQVQLRYTSSAKTSGAAAFHAAGRDLVSRPERSLVGRATGSWRRRGPMTGMQCASGRPAEAAALGVCGGTAFPVSAGDNNLGTLVVFAATADHQAEAVLDRVAMACDHIGRFLERARIDAVIQQTIHQLSALASTDQLTGLKNRREFDRALRTIPREPFSVLSIDVDCLKDANDAYGHAAGDALLRQVGETLGLMVRGWDVMARVGGDEFAALLPGVGVFGAPLVAERMRLAVHALDLPSGPVRLTVGWSAAPAGVDPASVWQRADERLYDAKRAGRDRVLGGAFHSGEAVDIGERAYSDVVERLLAGEALTTVFQPIVSLSDGSVAGYEALARPVGFAALDSVESVFEAARVSGQIRDLDWICRRRALEDAMSLPVEATLFLNISASALLDSLHGVDQLLLLLRAVKRPASTVVLEITEHEQIRDYAALRRILVSYRAEGIRFALDDVGEGHSTLELLAASGGEYLKLGRSLTMTSTRVESRAAIHATMAFARVSGATVIAEGIENELVADLMREVGVELGQGFGLGRPTLAGDLENVGAAFVERAALSTLRPRVGITTNAGAPA